MLNFNTNILKKETSLPYLRSNILALSFLLLLIAFYPQNLSAFFHTNQMNNPLYGNFGSSVTSLYSNPGSLYGSNFGSIYGGGGSIGGLGMNNGIGMMMPGYGYGTPSFGSGGLGGGMLDVISGILGGLGSSSNQGFGSNYNFDYGYESNYNNNLDFTLQPNYDDFGSFGYNSNYGSNSDFDYGSNEFQSDLPIEDLRSFDSSMEEQQQYSFQDDYDFSQTPLDDFSSNLFQ